MPSSACFFAVPGSRSCPELSGSQMVMGVAVPTISSNASCTLAMNSELTVFMLNMPSRLSKVWPMQTAWMPPPLHRMTGSAAPVASEKNCVPARMMACWMFISVKRRRNCWEASS